MSENSPQVKIITLGCAKNEVDSEEIAGVLENSGYKVGDSHSPDITVINTCGFLESAKQESIRVIREAVENKKGGKVVVAGCLAQRMGAELEQLAPGADAYIGVGRMSQMDRIVQNLFGRQEPIYELESPHHDWVNTGVRANAGTPWSAYLKVSEGCDHKCTFCTIPSFRGNHLSKPIEKVLEEARHLASRGVKEINLIAQDVTQYGFDLYKEFTLPKLLQELNRIDGLEWIRILYFYPNRLTDEVIEAMATCKKVVNYIDIPLQHAHPETLRRMKRPWDGERYLKLFEKVRASIPDIAIRTTFIVGFPGETKEEFDYLVQFTREAKLDRVGAFKFSKEPGTPAHDMSKQVSSNVKQQRFDELMRVQRPISLEINKSWIGKPLPILVEQSRSGWIAGRSFRDAPEIDGWVYAKGEAEPGSIIEVIIDEGKEYDLVGHVKGVAAPAKQMIPLQMADQPKRPL